jgi:hypothetical protein
MMWAEGPALNLMPRLDYATNTTNLRVVEPHAVHRLRA